MEELTGHGMLLTVVLELISKPVIFYWRQLQLRVLLSEIFFLKRDVVVSTQTSQFHIIFKPGEAGRRRTIQENESEEHHTKDETSIF